MSDPISIHSTRPVGQPQQPASGPSRVPGSDLDFAQTLQQAQGLRFSNHAQKRIQTRGIPVNDDTVTRLAGAVDKAEKRGSQSSLVMMGDLAFVVNVRERLVVTAMDTSKGGEGVFTQIDSVVIDDPAADTV